jgi:peptidoglycan/LPS O-acetylase OafA/YrhL
MFNAGYRGVDLFFVLSGFIIASVHADDIGCPDRLPNYLFNRLTRIYPSVWIMTGLAITIYMLGFGGADKAAKLTAGPIAASALLLPQRADPLVNVTWTLKYEVFFYGLFAVLIYRRGVGIVLLLLWQLATLWVALSGAQLDLGLFYFRSICLDFSVGLACAWLVRRVGFVSQPRGCVLLLGGGVAVFVAGMWLDGRLAQAGVLCALGAAAIVISLVWLERAGMMVLSRVLVGMGRASYAIYLVHFSVLSFFEIVLVRSGVAISLASCVACAAVSVLVGIMFHRFVDQPLQSWLHGRKALFVGTR